MPLVLVAQHNSDSSSTGVIRYGTKYLIGSGANVSALTFGVEQTFPSDGAPHAIVKDPVTKTILLFGKETGNPDGLTLWRTSNAGTSWQKIDTLASLLGISAADAYFPDDMVDDPVAFDASGNLLLLLDDSTNRIKWSFSSDLGDTFSAPQTWTGGIDWYPMNVVSGGGRWGVVGLGGLAVSDSGTPTDFTESLDSTTAGLETLFIVLGFVGSAWFITQPASDAPCLKRCTSSVMASGSWQAQQALIDAGWEADVFEGNGAGAVTSPFVHYPGGIKRLERAGGGFRTWLFRAIDTLLFSDATDGTGWDKSKADHDAVSSAGMIPIIDYRRQNFASGDLCLVADIEQDPDALDALFFLGWTFTQVGVTTRKAVYTFSLNGGDDFAAGVTQLPVTSGGEWGRAFLQPGGASGGAPAQPAPDKPARASRDSVIFDFLPLPGMNLGRFLRADGGWSFREREFKRLTYNQAMLEAPYVSVDRLRLPALLAEPPIPDGQLITHPFNFTPADDYAPGEWNVDAGITMEQAQPLLHGLPMTRLVNDGTSDWNGIWLDLVSTWTGDPQTLCLVVRRGTHDFAELWIWDPGISDDVLEVRLNLRDGTTNTIYGEGNTRMIRLPTLWGAPPAWLVFVTVTGTAGEVPEFGFLPTSRLEIAGFTDLGYFGFVSGSVGVNPLSVGDITGGTFWWPNVPALGESAWKGRLVFGGPVPTGADEFFWHRGQLDGAAPYLALRAGVGGSIYVEHDNGSDPAVQSTVPLSWREGDVLDYVLNIFPGGAVHLALALNAGLVKQGDPSEDVAIANSQYDDAVVLQRGTALQARCHHLRLMALVSSHITAVPGTSAAGLVLEEPRRYQTRTNAQGDVV